MKGGALGAVAGAVVVPALLLVLVFAGAAHARGGSSVPGGFSPDAQAAAKRVLASGRLVTLSGPDQPDHLPEVRWIAEGKQVPGCGLDVRTLQVLELLVQRFEQVGVSDLNRQCTGQVEGGGYSSSHWIKGGGMAIDVYMLNGQALTGRDELSVEMIRMLDAHMPAGSRVGQSTCGVGFLPGLHGFTTQFSDSCNHVHLDVAYADGPLR